MRRLAAGILAGLILVGSVAALAAGGTSSDPLISRSYIDNTYIPATVKTAGEKAESGLGKTYGDASARLKARADLLLARAGALSGEGGYAASFAEQRFKRGDVITIDTGSSVMLLAGTAAVSYEGGGVVDATEGTELPQGGALAVRHRYLAAEDTLCSVTVTSDTAVLAPQGFYAVTESDAADYNALAAALGDMGMFKGSDVAYGGGYELERAPTRIEGLILFLRLIGEEDEALACSEPCPFVDVADWCKGYVTYAYAKGYTKGVGADTAELYFAPLKTITAGEYLTFVLRALGYQDSGDSPDFTWSSALSRSVELGVLTAGEQNMLTGSDFLRAQVAYVSYYSLDAKTKAGGTLLGKLTAAGALDAARVKAVRDAVTVQRLG